MNSWYRSQDPEYAENNSEFTKAVTNKQVLFFDGECWRYLPRRDATESKEQYSFKRAPLVSTESWGY